MCCAGASRPASRCSRRNSGCAAAIAHTATSACAARVGHQPSQVVEVGVADLGLDDDCPAVHVPHGEVRPNPAVPPLATEAVKAEYLLAGRLLVAGDLQARQSGALRQHRRAGGEPAAEVALPRPLLPRVADGPAARRAADAEAHAHVTRDP